MGVERGRPTCFLQELGSGGTKQPVLALQQRRVCRDRGRFREMERRNLHLVEVLRVPEK